MDSNMNYEHSVLPLPLNPVGVMPLQCYTGISSHLQSFLS